MTEALMTESEFCSITKLSRSTVYRLRETGRLKFIEIGRRVLYSRSILEEFVREATKSVSPRRRRRK